MTTTKNNANHSAYTPKAWGIYWEDKEHIGSWGIGLTEEEALADARYDGSDSYLACSGACETLEECYAWLLSERAHVSIETAREALRCVDTANSWFRGCFTQSGTATIHADNGAKTEYTVEETWPKPEGGLLSLCEIRIDMCDHTVMASSPERAMLRAYNDDPSARIWFDEATATIHVEH